MTETPEGDHPPEEYARFSFTTRSGMRYLRLQYQGCFFSFAFPATEQGIKSASNLAESFHDIWTAALTEQGITEAMDGFDEELNELLGGDDSHE